MTPKLRITVRIFSLALAVLSISVLLTLFPACKMPTFDLDTAEKLAGVNDDGSEYTLTFDSNGGSAIAPQKVAAGGYASQPSDPAKTGYLFGAWYADAGLTTVWTFGTDQVTANVTLYAAWNTYLYTVVFDGQGADTDPVPATIDVISPETNVGTLPAEPALATFHFGGWWTAPGGGGTEFTAGTTVTAPLTVYSFWSAVPTYTVTFESNGGSPVAPETVPDGDLAADPGAPFRPGYAFDGWFADAGLTTPWLFAADTVTADITLYAGWTANSYDIVFDADGGGGAMPLQPVDYDQTVTLDANAFTRTGYSFDGWSLSAGGPLDYFDAASYTHTTDGNVILYARWAANAYNIIFEAEGGSGMMADQPVDYDQTVTLSANAFTLAGYTFDGWSYTSGGAVDHVDSDTYIHTVTADRTLYALWREFYQVTYDGNGHDFGSPPSDLNNYAETDTVTVLAPAPALEKIQDGISLRFSGWNTASDGLGTQYLAGETFAMPPADRTLFAQWEVIGGVGPGGGLVFHDKGSVSEGWRYLEAGPADLSSGILWGGSGILTGTSSNVPGRGKMNTSMIVGVLGTGSSYAARLAYEATDGAMNDWFLPTSTELDLMRTVLYDHVPPLGSFADADYWTSREFAATDSFRIRFTDGSEFATPKTLATVRVRAVRAFKSPAATYTVRYDSNGATGGVVPAVDWNHYEAGENATVRTNSGGLVRTGHNFAGWNTADDGSGTDYAESSTLTMGADNQVLYAKWTPVSYSVTYSGNGHTAGTPPVDGSSYLSGATVTPQALGSLIRLQDGISLRFTGWNQIGGGGGTRQPGVDFAMPAENITLEAIWEVIGGVGPGGGLVFHDKGSVTNGWRYLEAAPVDQSAGINWGPNDTTGATFGDYGDGALNTALIVSSFGAGTYAAKAASDYAGNGFSDWYLPSQAETYRMYQMLHQAGLGGFSPNYYWSSGEGLNVARRVNFADGAIDTATRGNSYRIRSVRAFGSTVPTYIVAYLKNGADSGDAPVDLAHYEPGQTAAALGGAGTMVLSGHSFSGWNTAADGSGTDYPPGSTPAMPSANLVIYAQWAPLFTGGDGSPGTPYLINSPEGLDAIRSDLTASYELVSDIDLGIAPWNSGAGWSPISTFSGTLEGNSHTIYNLFINLSSGAGLFDNTQGAVIQNLTLDSVNITAASGWAGAVAGRTDSIGGGTTIINVSANGTVTGGQQLGGLVGLGQNLSLSRSFADVDVVSTTGPVGGLIGRLSSGTIDNCYALGSVNGDNTVGGLAGLLAGSATNTYAAGAVTGNTDVGGLVGSNMGTVNDSYYDQDTTGQTTGAGMGRTTAQMMIQGDYPGWDFVLIWDIVEGSTYPFLR